MYDMYLSRHLTRQREKLDEKSDAGTVQIQNIFLSLRNILAKSSYRASLNAVNLLWICCEFAVDLLWICCEFAVVVLWQCCDYAVNIISCAIDVIMMYDSYRLPTRPPNADGHYYYSIDAPSSYTVTHLDASPSTVVGAREKERARRAIAVVMIVIVGCRRWYIDINRIITWERLDMLGRKGREINRKGREREWMQQSKH
jgi:hypothetical protein